MFLVRKKWALDMVKKAKKLPPSELTKLFSKIKYKVNPKLDDIPPSDTPFIRKKMEEAERILAIAGVPK
jgi:hypothetical protein